MSVEFENYSVQVKEVIREKAIAFLYEIGGEIRSMASRNSRRKTGQTAGSYDYQVDEGELGVHIGSDFQNAIWEEYGTGEFSINGGGRSGYWIYVEGSTGGGGGKNYPTLESVKKAVAILQSKGVDAKYTKGKTANRPLYNAFNQTRPRIEEYARKYFGEI